MGQRAAIAIDRFSPSPGIFVDRSERVTTITGAMELWGPEATAARAATATASINTVWTQTFADRTSVACSVTVRHRSKGQKAGPVTQIKALAMKGPSFVGTRPGGRFMKLNSTDPDAFNWTVAHEFGHILGLDDRYSESIASQIRGTFGGKRTTTVQSGYAGNIMAVDHGTLEAQNLVDFADETAPRRGRADDRVRDWIRVHSIDQLRKLSNDTKIDMINTLIGGVVTGADIAAIERICDTVFMRADAESIRAEVSVWDIERSGPREKVKLILARMNP